MEPEQYYSEYEIDLREYMMLLWDQKWLIIGLFIITVLGAGIYSQFFIDPVYETEAVIIAPSFRLLDGKAINRNDYTAFFRKPELEENIIGEFNLRDENPAFSLEDLNRKLDVNISKDINENEDVNTVTLRFKDNEPELAANILNYWIDLFQQEVQKNIVGENNMFLDRLKAKLTEAEDEYTEAQKKQTSFQKEINLRLLNSRLKSNENRLVSNEKMIVNLENNLKKNETEYNEVLNQLEVTKQFIITRETITDTSLRKLKVLFPDSEGINNLTTENERLNSLYINLMSNKNRLEQDIAVTRAELDFLTADVAKLKEEIDKQQQEIAEFEENEALLLRELKIASKNYNLIEEAYSSARQQLAEKNYQITLVNKAVVPETPISPNKKLNTAIAGVLALMLGVFIVFFREFMKDDKVK